MKKLLLFSLALLLLSTKLFAVDPVTATGSGLSATYPSLAAAITALNGATITSPVVITLTGPETAPAGGFAITATGTVANTITVQGSSSTITAYTPQASGLLNDAIFKIIGGDYITISGFTMLENGSNLTTVAGTNNMTEWGVALLYATTTNGSQNCTIQNNTITLNRLYQNTFGIYSNSTHSATAPTTSATATTTAGGNSGLKIYGNNISNVNNGIVVVGPTAAADHNTGIDIGGAGGVQANSITNYGTTGTFSGYANVSGTVNGILVRNSIGFNISYNTVTSSNGGTTAGTLNGIQIPASTSAPTATFTNNITYNIISLRSANAASAMNGITYPSGSSSATSTLNVNNNDFNNFGHTVAGTGAINFISVASINQFTNINSNTFTNISVNTTGSITFLGFSGNLSATSVSNINNNSIVTAFNKTGAGGTITIRTSNSSTPAGAIVNFQSNNFSNITFTGATTFSGYNDNDGGAPTKSITSNVFNNITGGTNSIAILFAGYLGTGTTISNNTITNVTGQGSITAINLSSSGTSTTSTCANNTISSISSTGTGGTVIGIACSSGATTTNVNNNTINGLSSTGASVVTGINVTAAVTTNVFKNKIYDLSGSNASSAVTGISMSIGAAVNIYNNIIGDLRTPAANAGNPLIGINLTGGTAANVYYNTIYLNATSSGALFGSSCIYFSSTTPSLNLRNNLLVNTSGYTGSGVTAVLRRSGGTTGVIPTNYLAASNNNDFYAGSASASNLLYVEGISTLTNPHQTMATYKPFMSPRDQSSFSQNATWVSTTGSLATYLHINTTTPTQIESGAAPIATYLDDFDGDVRNATTPDVGADEFTGVGQDLAPPTISYTALSSTCSDANITLTATISDVTGVPVSGTLVPRIYYKKGAGTWFSQPGTLATGTGLNGTWTFTIVVADMSGVASGDVISYYIIAQDLASTPNVGSVPAVGLVATDVNTVTTPPTTPNTYTILNMVGGTITPATANGCSGLTYTMTSTGATAGAGISYQWEISSTGGGVDFGNVTGGTGATSTSYTTGILTTGTYYYRLKVTCSSGSTTYSNELTLTVLTSPTVAVSPTTAAYCTPGSAVTLTASGDAVSYAWSPATGLNTTTGPVVLASPAVNTTYTVTGTGANGCTASAPAAITVGATVTMNSVTATPPSVCSGGSTILLANASVPVGAYCASTHASGCSGDDITKVMLGTINNSTTGCGGTSHYTYFNPSVATTTSLLSPAGSPYSLSVSFGSDNSQYFGAWIDYNQDGTFATTEFLGASANAGASGTVSISFTVPGSALNGATRIRIVGGNDNPVTSSQACGASSSSYGETQDYNVTITGASNLFTYLWSENPASGTLTSTTSNPTNATNILVDETYSVTATASSGCFATGSKLVTIGIPVSCVSITSPEACGGVNFAVTANTTGGGGTLHYAWSDGAGGVYADAQTVTANLAGGDYTFSVTVTDGCSTTCNMSQLVSVSPAPGGTITGPSTGLTYEPLNYVVTGYAEGSTFKWQYSTTGCAGPFTDIGGTTDALSINAITAGTFYIHSLVTGTNGCVTTSNCVITVVTVKGDNVCSAIPLSIGVNGPFTNVGATIETGEPAPPGTGCATQTGWCSGQVPSNSVWFTFVAPPSGRVSINFGTTNTWDSELALWSAPTCGALLTGGALLIAANDDAAGSPFYAAITPVCVTPGQTYYVQVDGYGITTNSAFNLVLVAENNAPPVISGCPGNISVPVSVSGCSANVSWTAPTASDADNCLTPLSFTSNYLPGANFPLGATTVTYTANDGINPPVYCNFTVTVTTSISAHISGDLAFCDGTSSILDAGAEYAGYIWSTGETTQTITVSTGETFSVTVTDAFGCAASASVTTTVNGVPYVPGSPVVTNILPNSFDLSWTYTGGPLPTTYSIDVATDNMFVNLVNGMPFVVNSPNLSTTITGLSGGTTYFYRITAKIICSSDPTTTKTVTTPICVPTVAPFIEDFETGGFPPACWTNPAVTGSFVWAGTTAASAFGSGTASAFANFFNQSSGTYELKTMPFDISGLATPTLKFNYAYATYVVEIDELDVYYSTNYGETWLPLLLMPGGPGGILSTAPATEGSFVPTASQWCTQSLALPAGTNLIKFTAISAYGNNLFLDNITVSDPAAEFVTLQDITVAGTSLYAATNSITVAGGPSYFTVLSGGSVTMVAGQKISFQPGTTVNSGGYLHGYISTDTYCNMPSTPATIAGHDEKPYTLDNANFTLYPNPTSGNFTIVQKADKLFGNVSVEIYSMRGEKVMTDRMVGEQSHEFNIAEIPAGLYFVKITAEGYTETIKLVRTR